MTKGLSGGGAPEIIAGQASQWRCMPSTWPRTVAPRCGMAPSIEAPISTGRPRATSRAKPGGTSIARASPPAAMRRSSSAWSDSGGRATQ
jgi:hypothetical protein